MLCKCIQDGTALIVGRAKPIWVEVGQIHDVELNEGKKIPANFEKFEPEKKKAAKEKDSEKEL